MQSRQTEREISAFYDGMRHMITLRIALPHDWWSIRDQINEAERIELELFRRQHNASIVGETLRGSGETD